MLKLLRRLFPSWFGQLESLVIFVPIIYLGKKRYRTRMRLCNRFYFNWKTDKYKEGDVVRIWAYFLLITIMIDAQI